MDRRSVICGFGGIVAGTLAGCLSDISLSADEKREITRTYDASDGMELRVRNENGPVTVQTYDDNVISVTIEIRSPSPEIVDGVSITDERMSNALVLETSYGNAGDNASVGLSIQIPNRVAIGSVQTSNASLAVDVPAIGGDIDIVTSNGSIDAALASGLNADVIATTTNSSVNLEGLDLKSVEQSDTQLSGTLGDGTHTLSLETTNASIDLQALSL